MDDFYYRMTKMIIAVRCQSGGLMSDDDDDDDDNHGSMSEWRSDV